LSISQSTFCNLQSTISNPLAGQGRFSEARRGRDERQTTARPQAFVKLRRQAIAFHQAATSRGDKKLGGDQWDGQYTFSSVGGLLCRNTFRIIVSPPSENAIDPRVLFIACCYHTFDIYTLFEGLRFRTTMP
jgi:hypothetical protein